MPEFNFAKSWEAYKAHLWKLLAWEAYKAHLTKLLGREPTTEEIREEMSKWGWEFKDKD